MFLVKQMRALQHLVFFIADQILEPVKGTKAGAAIVEFMKRGLLGKGFGTSANGVTVAKPKSKRGRRSRRFLQWFPLLFMLPTCFCLVLLLLFRSEVKDVTHGVYERAGHSIGTIAEKARQGRNALVQEVRREMGGGPVEIREVPVLVPTELPPFDEEDFVRSDLLSKGEEMSEEERHTRIKDKYWLNVWRLDAEFRRAAMDKMDVPIVNLPAVDRNSDPLCEFPPSEEIEKEPAAQRTVYDIFLFKDEVDLLDIRVHELESVVDWFVIVQCPISFMNRTVELVDPVSVPGVASFKHKIKRVLCDLETYPLQETSPWKREAHMRNVALDSILDVAQDEDLILYGDLDELPSMATIQKVVRAGIEEFPFVLQMPLYRTNFGCLDRALYGEKQWAGTIVTTGQLVKSRAPPFHENGNQLRWELRSHGTNIIKCSGWHCSSCMDVNTIIGKLTEYSHASEIGNDQKDPDILLDEIESCHFGFWKRTRTWRGLPRYVVANAERFAYLMPR